jgi:radical SAM protein with 4Fe4S-binding SPASM domain
MYFPSAPISYAVEITFACNNFCPGCANVLEANRNEILHEWEVLFDKFAPPENRRKYAELIRITGGEPTLHKEFRQIIEYVDTFGIPHATFTNGRWENPSAIIEIFKQCDNFVGLLVSLHGNTALTHNAFVGGDETSFEETCTNIQRAAESGIEIFTNTVLTKYNWDQIEEIIALSQRLGADYAVFNRYFGKPHPIEPTEDQLRQATCFIETLHNEGIPCRLGDCIPPCFERNSSLGSTGGIEHCAISPKGFVRPDNLTSYIFGNIFEQSIEEIWQSEKAQWYRSQLPEKCLECIELPRCRGGARSVTVEYGLEGDHLMKEPIQEVTPETLKLDPDWIPVPYFTVREEPFGYLLCRVNWSVPVSHTAKSIVDAINGQNTLGQLQRQFGDEAFHLVGYLYREDCIGFE